MQVLKAKKFVIIIDYCYFFNSYNSVNMRVSRAKLYDTEEDTRKDIEFIKSVSEFKTKVEEVEITYKFKGEVL